jgi:MFS transporter, DHA1 family, tetracycline resistance protein
MKNNRLLSSIFLIVFIDLLGFSLILPLLPFYAQSFGASPAVVGLLVASYAAVQMISAPILGRLSDRFGRRPILLVSIFGSFLGFIFLGFARSLFILFIARIMDGITGGNLSVAQAYISDVTDEKNRARGLGLIGAAFGLGFVIGPALGGFLSRWGYGTPAFLASALSLINLGMVAFWLPESLSIERRQALLNHKRPAISLSGLWEALHRPLVGPLLHTRFFFGLAFATFQTVFSLYALTRFGLDAQTTGYILAYVGVLSIITQGFLVGRLTHRFNERQLVLTCTVLMAVSLLGWALTPSVPVLLFIMIPLSFSGGILNTVINSAISKSVTPMEIGGILGLSSSIESLTRVIAPTLGGILLGRLGPSAPGMFSSLLMAALISYVYRNVAPVRPNSAAPLENPAGD